MNAYICPSSSRVSDPIASANRYRTGTKFFLYFSDNGTQFTSSRFLETLGRLGITHRRTAYHHPEGNSYIERFHRNLKEEEVWTAEYRSLEEARASIARWIEDTITTALIAEWGIALRTRLSWLSQVY